MAVEKIVSGGQTGVDRAALDVARRLNIAAGGWCPRGRKAEDGVIPPQYDLRETSSRDYAVRTRWNVRDSDGTLILTLGELAGGTATTAAAAGCMRKPCKVVNLDGDSSPRDVNEWLHACGVRTLNVAGPRESAHPGICAKATAFLEALLTEPSSAEGGTLPPRA